jgi:hypothetical protein
MDSVVFHDLVIETSHQVTRAAEPFVLHLYGEWVSPISTNPTEEHPNEDKRVCTLGTALSYKQVKPEQYNSDIFSAMQIITPTDGTVWNSTGTHMVCWTSPE